MRRFNFILLCLLPMTACSLVGPYGKDTKDEMTPARVSQFQQYEYVEVPPSKNKEEPEGAPSKNDNDPEVPPPPTPTNESSPNSPPQPPADESSQNSTSTSPKPNGAKKSSPPAPGKNTSPPAPEKNTPVEPPKQQPENPDTTSGKGNKPSPTSSPPDSTPPDSSSPGRNIKRTWSFEKPTRNSFDPDPMVSWDKIRNDCKSTLMRFPVKAKLDYETKKSDQKGELLLAGIAQANDKSTSSDYFIYVEICIGGSKSSSVSGAICTTGIAGINAGKCSADDNDEEMWNPARMVKLTQLSDEKFQLDLTVQRNRPVNGDAKKHGVPKEVNQVEHVLTLHGALNITLNRSKDKWKVVYSGSLRSSQIIDYNADILKPMIGNHDESKLGWSKKGEIVKGADFFH